MKTETNLFVVFNAKITADQPRGKMKTKMPAVFNPVSSLTVVGGV